ncbi:MAG: DUF1800 domain-containing protein [Planctomycetia bacterium]|nr:DUF1800 domain-containing protein [Planctomycetia bacterium]
MTDASTSWKPYEPGPAAPWNLRRVVHLRRRAGFAGTWSELQRDLSDGPQEAIDRFLAGHAHTSGVPEDFEAVSRVLGDAAVSSSNPQRLKAWWVYRMVFSPDPLAERLALMWHNHFATSNVKVNSVASMREQNETFRQSAKAPFNETLARVVKGPAMLVWLDADKNRAGHANENLARELMELFTLSIGHYSERDVQEVARALTGWRVVGDAFRFDPAAHDDGEKTILGRAGRFAGGDVLALLAAEPATAKRLAWRIGRTLLSERAADAAALDALADGLRDHELDVGWAIETVLRSERFFSDGNMGSRVVAPAEHVVGTARALEYFSPPPSTLLLAEWMARMGQELFYPPNVGGWNEGRTWLTSAALVSQANFAAALVDGRLAQDAAPPDLAALVSRHVGDANLSRAVEWFGELFFGGLSKEARQAVEQAATSAPGARGPLETAALLLLSRPEACVA